MKTEFKGVLNMSDVEKFQKILDIDNMPKELGKVELLNVFNAQARALGMTYLFVEKQEVEALDMRNAYRYFKKMAKNGAKAKENTFIIFDGHDRDIRELYAIPSVRKYIQTLVANKPEILYYLSSQTETLQIVLTALFNFISVRESGAKTFIETLEENKDNLESLDYDEMTAPIPTLVELKEEQWDKMTVGIMEFFTSEGMEQEGLELIQKIESMFE